MGKRVFQASLDGEIRKWHIPAISFAPTADLNPYEIYKVEEALEEAEQASNSGVEESELDEMWSFVGNKKNPRWLWHAIDRSTGQVLQRFGVQNDECRGKEYSFPRTLGQSVI